MTKDKNRIWVRFSVEESDTEMHEYFKNIPAKHRAWVAKKLFLDKLKNLEHIAIATTPAVSEKSNVQQTKTNNTTPRKIHADF